jgi:glycosyltransferase involved in cell wall biosynthesis
MRKRETASGYGKTVRTVLDVTVCAHSAGGVGRWVRGLSAGLSWNSQLHISIDLPETHPGHPCTVRDAVPVPSPDWMAVPLLRRILLGKGRLEASRERRIQEVTGIPDIIHLSGVQPFGRGTVRVVTFFDDTPWTEPENHTGTTLFYASRLEDLISRGAAVMAISRWAAERVSELFGIPGERIGVVRGAADGIFTPGEPDGLVMKEYGLEPGGYLLHVGSFVPRKNIPFLIECFRNADGRGRKLVLAGAERWGMNQDISGEELVVLESISDRLLLSLYRGAEALVVPSTGEGLGLPVLEALACGTPVISSDGGALAETVSSYGLVLPVNDRRAWTDAISQGADAELKRRAMAFPGWTWEQAGAEALDFYRSLL